MLYFCFILPCSSGILPVPAPSRQTGFGNNFNFEYNGIFFGGLKTRTTLHVPDTAVYRALQRHNISPEYRVPKSLILLGVKLNPDRVLSTYEFVMSNSKTYSNYFIADGSEGVVIVMGINKSNIKDYRYRVVENDSAEIVPWSKIPETGTKLRGQTTIWFYREISVIRQTTAG